MAIVSCDVTSPYILYSSTSLPSSDGVWSSRPSDLLVVSHSVTTWRHLRNRKYAAHYTATITCDTRRKFRKVWPCGVWDYVSRQTYTEARCSQYFTPVSQYRVYVVRRLYTQLNIVIVESVQVNCICSTNMHIAVTKGLKEARIT